MRKKHVDEGHEERSIPSVCPISDPPEDSFQMVNKYGTYNIQPTAEGAWAYPAISQGLSRKEAQTVEKEREEWWAEQQEEKRKK